MGCFCCRDLQQQDPHQQHRNTFEEEEEDQQWEVECMLLMDKIEAAHNAGKHTEQARVAQPKPTWEAFV